MTRYGWMAELRPEKVEYYKQLHAKPWPAVLQQITASNLRNYSIYLREIEGRFFLFSYFEYVGATSSSWTRRHWSAMASALDGATVWSAVPCQIEILGHGPR